MIDPDKRARLDAEHLLAQPEFVRFLWRAIQRAGIFNTTTDGSAGRDLGYFEGRRSLGLELLDMAESGQPASHPDKLPILTLLMVMREEAQSAQPVERNRDSKNRTDRYSDLEDDPA